MMNFELKHEVKSPDIFNLGGTFRTRAVQETLEKIKPLIKKAQITRLVQFTHLDCLGIPVYSCIRPLSKNLSTSQGKGITHPLAMCSAYMEAIECFFAEQVHTDYDLSDTENFAPPSPLVNLESLQAGAFYTPNLKEKIKEWTVIQSLISEEKFCIPTHYLKFDLSTPAIENAFFKKTTTGLASGNTQEEAVCHALFEIIERNAKHEFDRLSPDQKKQRLINLNSVNYPEAQFLIERLKEHQIDILLFDITNQFGYPSFSCIIGDQNPFRKLGHYAGAGTHAHAGIAACRALTEAIQSRLTYIAGSRDDILPSEYKNSWIPLILKGEKDFSEIKSKKTDSLSHQYQELLTSIQKLEFDILFYIHTQPDDPISVVKCIIPGLKI
jgi:ribosomal protein S12 methylthiotransferase accessory factor